VNPSSTRTWQVRVELLFFGIFGIIGEHVARTTMSAGSAWPLVRGALVSHGSLVRVRPASDVTSLSLLCIPSSRTAWPLVRGALVSHGLLVRVLPASDATSLSLLCSPSSRAECDFLAHVTAVQGWVLEYNQLTSAWHIFLFCFLRNVSVPSEHMVVMSCIPMSLTLGLEHHWHGGL